MHIDEFTSRPNPSCHCRPEGSSNPRTVVYDIDESRVFFSFHLCSSASLFLSIQSSSSEHSQSALSLRLFLSSFFLSVSLCVSFSPRSLLWFHIDEFIVDTARSIVTKIVYDIDSSFYVNPVSEWFWSTWRDEYAHFAFGRAYAIEHREERKR